MIFKLFLLIICFDIFSLINSNEEFHFGIINHQTQWFFHCPENNTKILNPPTNDQPLISYECQQPAIFIEILPIEFDLTFLCRSKSRLIWIIIDLYQYNTYFWLIHSQEIEVKIELNNQIELQNSTIEFKNYTNRYIIIHAFYIPFESIDVLLNQQIEIHIQIRNRKQLNQCQFYMRENYVWQTFIENSCDAEESKTVLIQYAKCDFYTNQVISSPSVDTHLQVRVIDNPSNIITNTSRPDLNMMLSTDVEQNLTTSSILHHYHHHHHYLSLEENYRQILALLSRSTTNSILLKLIFLFLLIILILLVLLFVYMLCYHYRLRSNSSSAAGKNSSVSI